MAAWTVWLAAGWAVHPGTGPGLSRGTAGRIVSLSPELTEILFALGLGDRVVGVTQCSDYPPEADDKPKVGSFWQAQVEAIVGLKADRVVAGGFAEHTALVWRLNRLGCRCLTADLVRLEDVASVTRALGQALGAEAQAEQLSGRMAATIQYWKETTLSAPHPKVLWIVQREPLRVAGPGTFIHEMIDLAGGRNVMGPSIYAYPPLGGEQVLALAPEVIIEPGALGDSDCLAYWSGRYPSLPAVRQGRVFSIDPGPVSRLGPRIGQGIEQVARCLGQPAVGGGHP